MVHFTLLGSRAMAVDQIAYSMPSCRRRRRCAPVMKDALSDARNTMVWAISSGLPDAFERHARDQAGLPFVSAGKPVQHPGLDRTGATTLTRTPDAAASSAADLVSPSTACLLAA